MNPLERKLAESEVTLLKVLKAPTIIGSTGVAWVKGPWEKN